ncbi:DUF6576 domain-containing protein [uncultured Kordia sp.]|uniref:DUF6576 domain-containing protein n=1 Tax=uncultured Kordia sp. TaxID=507699 RepID=UPI00261C5302|nr:DUF6576 domain-containing protein [uncultured Kordia sp.]
MNIMVYLACAVIAIFIYIKFFKPKSDGGGFTEKSGQRYQTIDDKYNAQRKEKQQRIDRILEKINEKGVASLTPQEKALLDEYSNSQ